VFRRLRDLMANICWRKSGRQSRKGIGKYEGSPTLSKNFMKLGPQTAQNRTRLFTHPHYFVLYQSTAHPLLGINVAPQSDSKWNAIGFVCSSDLRHSITESVFEDSNAIASGGLKWQHITIIATLSSVLLFYRAMYLYDITINILQSRW